MMVNKSSLLAVVVAAVLTTISSVQAQISIPPVSQQSSQSSQSSLQSSSQSSSIASAASPSSTSAGVASGSDCISLNGSSMCPAFTESYVSPSNLTLSYPFFSRVSDLASFDRQFRRYFNDYEQFRQTKIHEGLQCNETDSRNATLQWQQTVLCGKFAATSYNAGCTSGRNQTTSLVCQETCQDYSDSEHDFVNNATYCTPTDQLRPRNLTTIRQNTIENDMESCTSWTALYSADTKTCISGIDNEANCGWGFGVSDQLCSYCDSTNGKSIASCCYDSRTTLTGCAALGYRAAAQIKPTSTSTAGRPSDTGSGAGDTNGDDDEGGTTHLSGGQLAGIVIGCVAGALLLGALLAWLLLRNRRNQNNAAGQKMEPESQSDTAGMIAGAAAAPSNSPREKPYTFSEESARLPSQEKTSAQYNNGSTGSGPFSNGLGAGAAAGVGAAGLAGAGALAAGGDRPLSTATSSGTDGRGTTVSSVRCQYTGQDISPGDSIVAIYPYKAGLSDELDLVPESHELLSVVRIYDDGWCLLRRLSDGKEGAAPLVCCQSSKGELPAHMRRRNGNDSSTGTGTGTTGTGTDTETGTDSYSNNQHTSSVGGAVTADEFGFTSDAASR
ncbi:unnamed protein product [Sympodiomycopsis kandeliae]